MVIMDFPALTAPVLGGQGELVKVEGDLGLYWFKGVGRRGVVLWLTPEEVLNARWLEEAILHARVG